MKPLLCLMICLFLSPPSSDKELSYRRITMEERIKEFYKTRGKKYKDKNIHILIPAAVLKQKPKIIRRPGLVYWFLYENQTVPLFINPKNIYLKRLNNRFKKEKKRKTLKHKVQWVSLFGRVFQPSWDIKGRCLISVHKIKTYGGKLKKSGG